jgi:hypothetical protein
VKHWRAGTKFGNVTAAAARTEITIGKGEQILGIGSLALRDKSVLTLLSEAVRHLSVTLASSFFMKV